MADVTSRENVGVRISFHGVMFYFIQTYFDSLIKKAKHPLTKIYIRTKS